jgi:hypothetical protein
MDQEKPSCDLRREVGDFGRGLPADFEVADVQKSPGMKVIFALARQLEGEMRV